LAGLDEQDITLVEHNFAALMSFSDALAERFYQRLFAEYPAIMPLFKSVTIEGQHKKLLASMVLLIQHLRDSEMIEDYLQGLGVRHQQYGVEQSHYEMFIENWLSVVAEFSEQEWDDTLLQAWRNVLQYVAELMQTPVGQVAEPVTVYQTVCAYLASRRANCHADDYYRFKSGGKLPQCSGRNTAKTVSRQSQKNVSRS
jgi:hemoglobin-like flavoprotein